MIFSKGSQSRGIERIRRAGLTGMSSMIAQGITIAAGFISVPLTVGYLGKERYGIWLTINGLLQWLYVSNMGLSGNAIINKLSEAHGKDDKSLAQELVSTAFWTLGGLSAAFLLLFAIVFPFVNWSWVFNSADVVSNSELHLAVIFAFVSFVMMFPTSMVDGIYQSYQEGFIGNIWNIAGSVFSLIALIFVTRMQGGLPLLVASLFGVRLLFSLINAGYLFFIRHPWIVPKPKSVTKKSFKSLLRLGGTYFIAQMASISLTQSQPFIITQMIGPAYVGVFNIAMRIMFLPTILVQMFLIPLMPAYGEAKARGDWDWIRKTLRRTLLFSGLVTVPILIFLVFFAQKIILLWVKQPDLVPSNFMVYGLGFFVLFSNLIAPISVMLYGLEKVKSQAVIAIFNAIAMIVLSIVLIKAWGENGLVSAMMLSFFFTNFLGQIIYVYFIFAKEMQGDEKVSEAAV